MNVLQFKNELFYAGKEAGFSHMELYYERKESFNCGIFKGEIDSYEQSDVHGISFRGEYEGKIGYAYTEKLDKDSIPFLLKEAKENALYVEGEPELIFAGSDEYENHSFYSDSLAKVSTEEKISFLQEVEKEIYAYDKRVIATEYFKIGDTKLIRKLYNTKGLSLDEKINDFMIYVSLIVQDGNEIKSGVYYHLTRDFSSLDAKEIAKLAVEDALGKLGATSIQSKSYPVVLHNRAAASLLNTFSPIFSAEKIQKGQSLLKDKIGEQIASANVNIIDDPTLKEGALSRNFDAEGVPTKKLTIIQGGMLRGILHNQVTAQKEGCQSTGHGYRSSYKSSLTVAPTNLFIEPGEKSFEQLIAGIEEGVLIKQLEGLHSGTNPISGDFSVAAQGFYIENGKISLPLNQMTIAGNFYELLKDVEEAGSDLQFALSFVQPGHIGSPSLLIKQLAVTVE